MKKVVLITGCSTGIGYYSAITFARKGYCVFASVRDIHSNGEKALEKIARDEKLELSTLKIDITDEISIKKGIETILNKEGRIDILVNNAGVMYLGPVELFSIDEIKKQFDINFFGTLRMIKEVVPIMRNQKSGKIINISSINGLVSAPLYGIYSSSKFALETASEVLKFELAPFGIKVALVEPGVFDTNFWKNRRNPISMDKVDSPYNPLTRFLDKLNKKQNTKHHSVVKKLIHPQRVADVILRIAKEENPKLRHIVGYDALLLFLLRKILPERLWFYILSKVYKW